MTWLKLLVYTFNVYVMQCLGKVNVWLFPYEEREFRRYRLCYCDYEDAGGTLGKVCHISCCDCGASHYFWKANRGIYGVPMRPFGYNYHLRLSADAVLADDHAKERWNKNR